MVPPPSLSTDCIVSMRDWSHTPISESWARSIYARRIHPLKSRCDPENGAWRHFHARIESVQAIIEIGGSFEQKTIVFWEIPIKSAENITTRRNPIKIRCHPWSNMVPHHFPSFRPIICTHQRLGGSWVRLDPRSRSWRHAWPRSIRRLASIATPSSKSAWRHQQMGIVIPPWDGNMVKMVKCLVVEPPSPLKNDGVRQLGWLFHSQLFLESHKIP